MDDFEKEGGGVFLMDARTVEENKKSRGGVKPSCFRFKTFYGAGWCVDTPAALKRFLAYATLQFECEQWGGQIDSPSRPAI